MSVITENKKPAGIVWVRSRNYLIYLMIMTGLVAIMDQYISLVKTTALPYLIEEYGVTPERFSWMEAGFLAFTFLVFVLNGLNDIIGRKYAMLVLVLIMGLSSLSIVMFTPTLLTFMIFYTLAMFTTVSNMWTLPVSEEAPAQKRAKYVSIVYVIGLIPLQAILPPIIVETLGLNWRWIYGVMFLFMVPVLIMWMRMKETHRFQTVQKERISGERKKHFYGLGVINKQDMRYILISASIWLSWLIYQFLYMWAGYYFMTIKGYSLSDWSLTLLATLILAMIGGVLSGSIMDRIGRKPALIWGCIGLSLTLVLLGFANGWLLPVTAAVTGFFTSFTYTWIVVYVPEVFPTERRGACMGWTTTAARFSYVIGPALAAVLLKAYPDMQMFWVIAGAVILLPIAIIYIANPYETRVKELEDIEVAR